MAANVLSHFRHVGVFAGNVRFETVELDTFDTARRFDAVIGRLVLLYQPDPAATLRRFRNFLKSDGIMAFQEIDMEHMAGAGLRIVQPYSRARYL